MRELSNPFGLTRGTASEPKASVLLVDDCPANLLSLRAILGDLDQNLVEARSGEEALRRLESADFAVVLLDVMMPGMSGFETARQIRGDVRFRHTPIIFLTANDAERAQLEEAYSLGAVDFLVKPLMPVVLQAKVRGFIELYQDKQRARREADQLRLLVQGTADYAIFMLDPEGHVASWNSGAERIKGYKADEIIGQHFSQFYPPEAIARSWPAQELEIAKAEGRFEDEGWRVRKDGTQFWANVVITALRDDKGVLRGFSKVTRDLTARKQAEESPASERGAFSASGRTESVTTPFLRSTRRGMSPRGIPVPSASRVTRPTRSSASTSPSSTRPRPLLGVGLLRNSRSPKRKDASRTRAGASARTARSSGPTSSSRLCVTRTGCTGGSRRSREI